MTKYQVNLETIASFYVTVEADDEERAVEAAFEETPSSVCAHCSGWGQTWGVELGEWGVPRNPDGTEADYLVEEVES